MSKTNRLKGYALIDATIDKMEANELLTMREWRLLHLVVCYKLRDEYFPKFCQDNGIAASVKLTPKLWKPIWHLACDTYHKEHQAFLDAVYKAAGIPRN